MDTSYLFVAGISIICLFAGILHFTELDLIKKESVKRLRYIAYFIIFQIVLDTLFKALEGDSHVDPIILHVVKTIELSLNPFLPYLIIDLFNNGKNTSRILKWIIVIEKAIISINFVLQLVSLFGNFMFFIDNNNVYQRTGLTFVYAVCLALSFGLMIIGIYIFTLRIQKAGINTLYGICLIFSIGYFSRIISTSHNFDWLCISIAFIFLDIYYVDMSLRLDSLTHLLNRSVYETNIERINYSTLFIMIDANCFKLINDTYGHECGDRTLRALAKCILRAYGDIGWCYRIGGDEFCVILKPNAFKALIDDAPKSDVYIMSERLLGKLDDIIKEQASHDDHCCLQYGVSQGYAIYYNPEEYPSIKNNMPLEKVIRLADIRMYRKKNEFKKTFSESKFIEEQPLITEKNKRAKVVYEPTNPELIEGSAQD